MVAGYQAPRTAEVQRMGDADTLGKKLELRLNQKRR